MEASDSFGQGVEIGADDPFAGTDFGDFGDEQQPSENAGTTELKTVDREGNEVAAPPNHAANDGASVESAAEGTKPAPEVSPAPAEQTPAAIEPTPASPQVAASPPDNRTEEERAENARQYREAHGEGEYAPPPREGSVPVEAPVADPTPAESGGVTGSTTEDPTLPSSQQPAEPVAEAATEQERREEEGDVPVPPQSPATSEGSSPAPEAPAASAEPQSGGNEEDAPEPEETRDSSGKTTKRKYVVLQVVGPGKFEQVTWYEKDGEIVAKGTPGSKRQGIALVRGAEDALKLGYAALGSPTDTIHLVAVAQLHFQPKPVRPAAPRPSAVRLQIG